MSGTGIQPPTQAGNYSVGVIARTGTDIAHQITIPLTVQ